MIDIPTDLTPELVPLSWLLGTWEGDGRLGEGESGSTPFRQRASFTQIGLPFLWYTAESWLMDEDGTVLRPLTVETGFWSLDRALVDADGGPGLVPADIVPALTSAEDVEKLRNADGGFDITATIVHPGGISELYYGQIKGPQIHLSTDLVMRGQHSRPYTAATRILGLVQSDLLWRWDVATDDASLAPHGSAILHKVSQERRQA